MDFTFAGNFLYEQVERSITRIQFHSCLDETMHGVRLTVIADDAKRLIWAKQTIRTTERLNDAFVVDNLIEIQRYSPISSRTQ